MNRWKILKNVGTNKHRQALVLCRCECGTEKIVIATSIRLGKSKSCGCLQKEKAAAIISEIGRGQRGKLNPQWSGGKHKNKAGYVLVYSPNHPRAKSRNYVFEHILAMEKMIGRFLLPKETVHHKNGIRDDNRPENLELWSSNQPSGQKVSDLVAYAKEILKLYRA